MNSNKFKMFVENDGGGHIQVFKAKGNAFWHYWNLTLKGPDEPILIADFFNETQFVVINRSGWIRAFDAESKEPLLDFKLNANENTSALLAADGSKVYIAFQHLDHKYYLATCSLDTFVINMKDLPGMLGDLLQVRNDGSLLFYHHENSYIEQVFVYKHYFSVLDIKTNTIKHHHLPNAPQFAYDVFKPVVDTYRNFCIMPTYDQVVYKQNAQDNKVFEYKIVLIDLATFEAYKVLTVRYFEINQLACYDSNCQALANAFLAPDESVAYRHALQFFYKNLTSILCKEDGIWLCWRGGVLRKIFSDFTMSPLLVTSKISNSALEGMFAHKFFHPSIYRIHQTEIILKDELNYFQSTIPELNASLSDEIIPLELQYKTSKEILNLSYSKKIRKEKNQKSIVQINVNNLATAQSIMVALIQMETIVSDLEAFGIDKILMFTVSDTKGNTLKEPQFFAKAIKFAQAPAHINTIVKKIAQSPKIKDLYGNEGETALCYAVFELAKLGENYLDTVIEYLAKIDLEKDVFNCQNLMPILEEKFEKDYLLKRLESADVCYFSGKSKPGL